MSPEEAPTQAGLLRRLAAIVYDAILLTAVLLFAGALLAIPLGITREHGLYPLFIAYVYLIAFLFFGWCWTHGGQTLGMQTWQLRVQRFDGSALTWGDASLRFIAAFLGWLPFGAGYWYAWLHPQGLTMHDLVSRTRIVLLPKRPQ
jgi:uncharacterized RDD family membrane protein YckC